MALQFNKLGTASVAASVGLIVGTVLMPALAETLNPFPSASPSPSYSQSPTEAPIDLSTDEPSVSPDPQWTPSVSVVHALELEYQGSIWVQIADVYNELCLDEGDYQHVQDQIDFYTSAGDLADAQLYQDRLDAHTALVSASEEQLQLLKDRMRDFVNTAGWAPLDQTQAIYQAKLERSRLEAQIVSKMAAARDGLDNARANGLDASVWQKQIDSLRHAQSAFGQSRLGF